MVIRGIKYAILIAAFIHLASATIKLECPYTKPQAHFPDQKAVRLGNDYEITLRFTNWKSNETTKFVERNFDGSLVVKKHSRVGEFSWINQSIYYTDVLDKDKGRRERSCKAYNVTENDMVNAYSLPSAILHQFNITGASFAPLLEKLVTFDGYNTSGIQTSEGGQTAGIETADWIACIGRNSGDDQPSIQLNVQFAGDTTEQQPYNNAFKNPHVYGLHIQLYKVENTSAPKVTLLEHFSYEMVTHDRVNPANADVAITPPRGIHCEGLPPVKLPGQLPTRFEFSISYSVADGIHPEVSSVDSVKLAYDTASKLVIFSMDFSKLGSRDSPLYGNITGFFGATKVIHDFNFGLEYTLDERGVCKDVNAIHADLGDVRRDVNGTLHMRSANELLFLDAADYYHAGKVLVDVNGLKLDSFVTTTFSNNEDVASPWTNETVVELLYLPVEVLKPDDPIHSINLYRLSKNGTHVKRVSLQIAELRNNTNSYNTFDLHNILPCLAKDWENYGVYDEKHEGDLFVQLDGVTLDKMKEVGLGRVSSAIAETIAMAANVSVLRIVDLELKQMDHELFAYFTIGQSSGIKPAQVADLKKELSVEEAQNALNETIRRSTGGLVVTVTGDDPRDRLIVYADKLGEQSEHAWPQPSPPVPKFVGYTLSAMLVLAFFTFIFGVSLVIGAYIFYEKRQSIRGMAYQVFE